MSRVLPSPEGGTVSASKEIPPRGSYRFVLRTVRQYDPSIPRLASTYSESQQSRDITHPDGRRAPTVFFTDPDGVDRLLRLGWEDVTSAWLAHLPGEEKAKPGKRAKDTVEIAG